ncbi:MAG: radical SAM family heme chaperone HemW [Planctomycetota bacterium]|nr:radical SAM family heme chaperone HemW [Planctomycetota bacterium]
MARKTEAPPPTLPRERAPRGTPLYVHLPFCAAKCHYCDFFSVAAEGHDRRPMVDAILAEAELWAPTAPRTVFVGGGTPSLLDEAELRALFDGLEQRTGFRGSAREVTVECNPESLDEAKAAVLLELGATRLSIGFQALDDAALKLFGRVHDAAQSFAAYRAARAAGAREVNVDLIYAWPGQDLEAWKTDLGRVLDLGPNHVSAYNLTFEEDTAFRRWLDDGTLPKAPEELELAFFEATRRQFAERGYGAYEISNFSLSGQVAHHNINYWHNGPYLGIGPSAVSKVGSVRGGNVKSVGDYLRRIAERGDARVWEEAPEALDRLRETWWLGLRLAEGLSAAEARQRAGYDLPTDPLEPIAERLCAEGLLTRHGPRFALSETGLPLGDWVARKFLDG